MAKPPGRRRDSRRGDGAHAERTPARPPRRARVPDAPRAEPANDGPALAAARVLWVSLVVLTTARAVLPFVPGMGLWGLNLLRFLSPLAWLGWLAAAATLVPAVGRRLEPWCRAAGDALGAGRAGATWAALAAATGVVLLLPDRVRFVGDFLMRQGTVEEAVRPSQVFPQALPLDVLLHYTLPRALTDLGWTDANGAARVLGAFEAAVMAWLGVRFARLLGLRGAAALACVATVVFGGTLGMFAGFGKAFAEMVLVAALLGVFGAQAVREGRGLVAVSLAFAAGVTLHRSALAFAPAAALVWVLWWRAHGRHGAWRRPGVAFAALVPLATLAVMVPRIVAIVRRWDPVHFAPYEVSRQGVLHAAFAGARPLDMLSLVLVLSPLALAVPLLWIARRGRPLERREGWVLLVLALPMLLAMPFIHPAQGMFRDWDDFAALGAALSLLAAWTVGETLRAAPARAWLAAAVVLGVAAPTLAWLGVQADLERGLARVEALMSEPPPRIEPERATTYDFLGGRYEDLRRYADAARAFSRAAEMAPSPRLLLQWAMLETMAGHLTEARGAYYRLLAKDSLTSTPWLGLATVATRAGDFQEGERAARRVLAIEPDNEQAIGILRFIERARRRPAESAPVPGGSPAGSRPPP